MPKPLFQNSINYTNIYGQVISNTVFFREGSPTFGNLNITGNTIIKGSLDVFGNTNILNTNLFRFEDNILLINRNQVENGTTLNQAGIEIERGDLSNYRIVYDESSKSVKIGEIGNLNSVVVRESNPLNGGVMTWDQTSKKILSKNNIGIDLLFSSNSNAVGFTNAAVVLTGGMSINKDLILKQKMIIGSSGTVQISSVNNDLVITTGNLKLQNNSKLSFGIDKYIEGNDLNNMVISSNNDIDFVLNTGNNLNIPNNVNLTFSTVGNYIRYADNKLTISSNNSIEILPTTGKLIFPENLDIEFGNENSWTIQKSGNTIIKSNRNIELIPSSGNIEIPKNSGIKLDFNKIGSDNSGKLYIDATSGVLLTNNSNLLFENNKTYINKNLEQKLVINGDNGVIINNTQDSDTPFTGAMVINGGMGVTKNVRVAGSLYVSGNVNIDGNIVNVTTENLLVNDNIIVINNNELNRGLDGGVMFKRSPVLPNDVYAGIFYKEETDELNFAYVDTVDSTSGILIPNTYIPIKSGKITVKDTTDVDQGNSVGSIVALGGIYIDKNLYVKDSITCSNINTTSITTNSINVLAGNFSEITVGNITIKDTENSFSITSGSLVLNGGLGLQKNLNVGENATINGNVDIIGNVNLNSTENATSSTSGALIIAGGVAIEKDLYIGGKITTLNTQSLELANITVGNVKINNELSVDNVKINSDQNSLGVDDGALTIEGGLGVKRNVYIGEILNVNKLICNNNLQYNGNGLFTNIVNTDNSTKWFYIGEIGFLESGSNDQFSMDIIYKNGRMNFDCTIKDSVANYNHIIYGDTNADIYIYKSPIINSRYILSLYIRLLENSECYVNIKGKTNLPISDTYDEGTGELPNGSTADVDINQWTKDYDTKNYNANTQLKIGNLHVEGQYMHISDNFPIIGYNENDKQNIIKNVGLLLAKTQYNNDNGEGEIVNDDSNKIFEITLPNQSTANEKQIVLSDVTSTAGNVYNGWWLKVLNGSNSGQVRKITNWVEMQRVAYIEEAWTGNNPTSGVLVGLYNSQYIATYYDNISKAYKITHASYDQENMIKNDDKNAKLVVGSLNITDTTISTNTTGALILYGGISILNTVDSTSSTYGGSLTTLGGGAIGKKLYVGESLIIGTIGNVNGTSLYMNKSNNSIKLQNDSGNYSYIDFKETGSNNKYGILSKDGQIALTVSNNDENPEDNNSNRVFVINSAGNIGIGTTKANTLLTLNRNSVISCDSNSDFIGIVGGDANNTMGGRMLVYGNNNIKGGDVELHSGDNGDIKFYTSNGTERFVMENNGNINVKNTTISNNNSSGALIIDGGLAIKCSQNATSFTNGGALTVAGGVAIGKDLKINGDLYVNGTCANFTTITEHTLAFSNLTNIDNVNHGDVKIIKTFQEIILSFWVEVIPNQVGENCQFEFVLPDKLSDLINRYDLNCQCSGWTDNTNLISIFNILGVGVIGTKRGVIKFQSVSTATHYFTIICRYQS